MFVKSAVMALSSHAGLAVTPFHLTPASTLSQQICSLPVGQLVVNYYNMQRVAQQVALLVLGY